MRNWKLVGTSLYVFQTLKDRGGEVFFAGWTNTGYICSPGETLEQAVSNYYS